MPAPSSGQQVPLSPSAPQVTDSSSTLTETRDSAHVTKLPKKKTCAKASVRVGFSSSDITSSGRGREKSQRPSARGHAPWAPLLPHDSGGPAVPIWRERKLK